MGADQQVPVGVHLQQVAVQGVKHQPPGPRTPSAPGEGGWSSLTPPQPDRHSPGGEGGVVLVAEDLGGVPDGDEVLQQQGEGQLLVVRGLVHCGGA